MADNRRRVFDWIKARRMAKAGYGPVEIGRRLGADRRSVARVLKMTRGEVLRSTRRQREALAPSIPRDRIPCPRCHGPMHPSAELCRGCRNETRLEPPRTRKVPGAKNVELRSVAVHRIVEFDGRFGVVVGERIPSAPGLRLVDMWDGGLEFVPGRTVVDVLEGTQVFVGEEPAVEEWGDVEWEDVSHG